MKGKYRSSIENFDVLRKGGDEMAKDPVCGMNVDEKTAVGTASHKGKTYYFCSSSCKARFEKEPEKYVQG